MSTKNEDVEKEYKKLKKLRLEAADKFSFINLLSQRLLVLVDSTDSDIYDFEDLLSNIRLTVEELHNYCTIYGEMFQQEK